MTFHIQQIESLHDSVLSATAECFARFSHGLGVSLSVYLLHSVPLSKRYKLGSRNFYCGCSTRTLVYRDKISCLWKRGFSSNKVVKEWHPLKDVILLLLARLV